MNEPLPLTEGELWSWIRKVMAQGVDIWRDHSRQPYERYSAHLDAAAAQRSQELWQWAALSQQPTLEPAREPSMSMFANKGDYYAARRAWALQRPADEELSHLNQRSVRDEPKSMGGGGTDSSSNRGECADTGPAARGIRAVDGRGGATELHDDGGQAALPARPDDYVGTAHVEKPEAAIEDLREALEQIAYMGLDCPAAAGPATDDGWYRGRAWACIGIARMALDDLAETQRFRHADGSDEKREVGKPESL